MEIGLFFLALLVLTAIGAWRVFEKAGHPGWAAIIPVYNMYILLQIVEKPIWWLILMFIPIAQVVVGIIVSVALAERFSRSVAFGIGLFFLGFIFFPVLGLGDSRFMAKPSEAAAHPHGAAPV